ncbi:MAG TPA: CBS domain-containing protein [Actinobacteria bacterium]|nr:inosine-5'-monophosphate dehydrogenase [bacterium BMS3Bbin02]HDL41916.1 CBS domain-containing protein [Actinomycetota bacterium]
MNVVDLMTTNVATVSPDTSLRGAARIMFRSQVSGLPVTDDNGLLVGIITEADFLRLELSRFESDNPASVESVADIMTRTVETIGPNTPLIEAAKVMVVREVKRLPVVDDVDQLVGIISRMDVVNAFTRPDEVIEDEIREDIVRRVLGLEPSELDVTVREGVVYLRGAMGTQAEARLLTEMTRRLDGVLKVASELTWPLGSG